MIAKLLHLGLLCGAVISAHGQTIARPNVPDKIKASAGENVVLVAQATGSQIYICQVAADGKPAWALKAPDAELHDAQGRIVGKHFAGPTWRDNDGSQVTGKVVAKVDSPDATSISWLLLTVTGHSGVGALSPVTSVQRIQTSGGAPPPASDCNSSKLNQEAKSAYTADYYFYAPAK